MLKPLTLKLLALFGVGYGLLLQNHLRQENAIAHCKAALTGRNPACPAARADTAACGF